MPEYSDEELRRLRSALLNFRSLSDDAIREVGRTVEAGDCPPRLVPFWPIMSSASMDGRDFHLFRKLEADPLVAEYGCYGFLPTLYPRLYRQGERPKVEFDGRTRGRVALFRFASGDGIVVKPLQSRREAEIAQLVGEAGAGPKQFPSLEGFLVEELVEGSFFTDLLPDDLNDETLYQVGRRLGSMLSVLHNAGICYNDATLSDPDGRSHLLIQLPDADQADLPPGCKLIDFGVSVLLDRFPDLEPEEVFNLVRTTPEYRLVSRLGLGVSELGRFLAQYRQRLASVSRDEILARDLRFTEEGLQQAAGKMGTGIIALFRQGFAEGYDK